jgi:hypothetical protein
MLKKYLELQELRHPEVFGKSEDELWHYARHVAFVITLARLEEHKQRRRLAFYSAMGSTFAWAAVGYLLGWITLPILFYLFIRSLLGYGG